MVWEEMKNKLVTSNQYHRIVINIKSKYSLKTLNGQGHPTGNCEKKT